MGIQDGGPNYGVSVTVNSASNIKGNFILDLTITNSYIRHTSVFVSFLKADGVTPMTVTDTGWLALLARQPLLAPRQRVSEVLCKRQSLHGWAATR